MVSTSGPKSAVTVLFLHNGIRCIITVCLQNKGNLPDLLLELKRAWVWHELPPSKKKKKNLAEQEEQVCSLLCQKAVERG